MYNGHALINKTPCAIHPSRSPVGSNKSPPTSFLTQSKIFLRDGLAPFFVPNAYPAPLLDCEGSWPQLRLVHLQEEVLQWSGDE